MIINASINYSITFSQTAPSCNETSAASQSPTLPGQSGVALDHSGSVIFLIFLPYGAECGDSKSYVLMALSIISSNPPKLSLLFAHCSTTPPHSQYLRILSIPQP